MTKIHQLKSNKSFILEANSWKRVSSIGKNLNNKNKKVNNLDLNKLSLLMDEKKKYFDKTVRLLIKKTNFKFRYLEDYEKNKLLNDIFEIIFSDKLTKSGYQKQHIWELSYKDSLNEFIKNKYNLDFLTPKFVRKNVVKRLNDELIYPYSPTFETDFVKVLFQVIFKKYFSKVNNLFEFGCGSAHNLVYASQIIPNVNLHGLDWSKNSIKIINQLNISHNLSIKPSIFDLFKPNYKINIKSTDGILTVGTLEQLGKEYKNFLKFLLKKKPKTCIHFETMNELYNNNSTLDYAAIQYMKKRNYLNGFLNDLKKLKDKKKIKIIKIRRIFGSQFHEGYSYVIWKPI